MKVYHFLILFFCAVLTACTTNLSPDQYTADELCKAQKVSYGKIVKTKLVKVEEANTASTGTLAGAYTGAYAGLLAGPGDRPKESIGLALIGAVFGGLAGHEIGKNVGTQKAIQYIVRLENGKSLAIVQGCQPPLHVGQRVMVLTKGCNRDRIVPA